MLEYDEVTPSGARFILEELSQLLIEYRKNHYKLGRLLHRIREQRLYESLDPNINTPSRRARAVNIYSSWEEFCNSHMGFSRSKGDQLVSNFLKLYAMGLDEAGDTFCRCMRLGWSKLNEVLRVAGNGDNLILWLDEAEGMTSELLRLKISQAQRTAYTVAAAEAIEEAATAPTGGAQAGTLPDGVEPPLPPSRQRTQRTVDDDPDAPLSPQNPTGYVSYQIRFPDNASQESFVTALRVIRTRYDSDMGAGTAVAMMALHYCSTVPRETEGGAPVEMEDMLRLMEATYGVRFAPVASSVEPSALAEKRRRAAKKKTTKR